MFLSGRSHCDSNDGRGELMRLPHLGAKVGYMGLVKKGIDMAQDCPAWAQIGGKMGPSSVWKMPIKRKLFVIASHIG